MPAPTEFDRRRAGAHARLLVDEGTAPEWMVIGAKVDYCAYPGRPPTSTGLVVSSAPERQHGRWVVWLAGNIPELFLKGPRELTFRYTLPARPGEVCVDVDACMPAGSTSAATSEVADRIGVPDMSAATNVMADHDARTLVAATSAAMSEMADHGGVTDTSAAVNATADHSRTVSAAMNEGPTNQPERRRGGHYEKRAARERLVEPRPMSREEVADLVERARRHQHHHPASVLTDRQFAIMLLLATGATNGEIAARVDIGKGTVSTHRGNILHKLGLRNNAELARFALRYGYTTL